MEERANRMGVSMRQNVIQPERSRKGIVAAAPTWVSLGGHGCKQPDTAGPPARPCEVPGPVTSTETQRGSGHQGPGAGKRGLGASGGTARLTAQAPAGSPGDDIVSSSTLGFVKTDPADGGGPVRVPIYRDTGALSGHSSVNFNARGLLRSCRHSEDPSAQSRPTPQPPLAHPYALATAALTPSWLNR